MPCSHLLCTFCVLKSHTERGCKHQKCPVRDCKQPTSSNKYIFADSGESKTLSTTVDDAELKNNSPIQWLVKKYRDTILQNTQEYQAVALSCSKLELNEQSGKLRSRTVTSTLLLKRRKIKTKTAYEAELFDLGADRVTDSFIKFCIDRPYVTTRTKDLVDMTKINTSAEKISNWVKQETTLRTSVHAADFDDRYFTRDFICAQIAKLHDIEKERETNTSKQMKIVVPKTGANKQTIIQQLIKIRTAMFTKHPGLLDDIKREMKLEFVRKGLSSKDSRRDVMANTFYALTANTKQDARYNTR